MPFIEWEQSFAVGVETFDEHHKQLVSLINQLYDDYTTEAPTETLGGILDELIDYATYHFCAEEFWMEEQQYHRLEEHALEHDGFAKKIVEMARQYKEGQLNISLDLMIFLKNWLTDHILKTDAEYARFIAVKGIPVELA